MFKKLLSTITFAYIFIVANVFAQQPPNAGFELAWKPQSGYSDPAFWATANLLSSNALVFGSNPVSVFKAVSPNVYSGDSAIKIVSFKYTPGFADLTPYLPNDTLGFALTGKIQPSGKYLYPGYTQNIRYAQLDLYAKYTPVGSDQGNCAVIFQKRNGSKIDTVAIGAVAIGSTSTYTKFTVNMIYKAPYDKSGISPDTATIILNSSYTKPQVGSTLWVDDLSFSGLVAGINERNMLINAIKVFPNPATDNITFAASVANESLSMVEIFDATGRRIDGVAIQNNRHELNLNKYAEGLYMYNAYNDKKELIGIGKFNVTK